MSTGNNPAAAQRDDGSLSNEELIDRYAAGPREIRKAFAGLNIEQLRARPIAGKWSNLEVLCHLADSEQFFAERIKRTLGLKRPLLVGVDPTGYPGPVKYQERDAAQELDLIELTRSQMTRILKLIEPAQWERQAVHSESGLVSIRGLVLHPVNHVKHHMPFIYEKRKALGLD